MRASGTHSPLMAGRDGGSEAGVRYTLAGRLR
jgi:hypothetical protein